MNINSAFPSTYIKSADLAGDVTYTIDRVEIESVGQGRDAEDKPIVYFREVDKGIVLNKTNAATIAKLYGPDTDGWAGNPITLFATEVEFQGQQTLAIRIRLRPNGSATAAAAASPQPSTVTAAKRAAWEKYKAAEGDNLESFLASVKAYLPAKPKEQWTAAEWLHFAADDFARKVADPRSPEAVFESEEIPF